MGPDTSEQNTLIVFAKPPRYGQVKTRLASTVGHEKALSIDKCELCSSVWLDNNEWQELKSYNFQEHVHLFYSIEWKNGEMNKVTFQK